MQSLQAQNGSPLGTATGDEEDGGVAVSEVGELVPESGDQCLLGLGGDTEVVRVGGDDSGVLVGSDVTAGWLGGVVLLASPE